MAKQFKNQYRVTKGGKEVTVELMIDIDVIAYYLVNRAVKGKSGKACVMHGAIVAKVVTPTIK